MEAPKYGLFWHYFIVILYLEILFKIVIFDFSSLFSIETILIFLYAAIASLFFSILSKTFSAQFNFFITCFLTFLISFLFGLEIILKRICDSFFSIASFSLASQVKDFADVALQKIASDYLLVLLILIPLIFTLIIREKLDIYRQSLREFGQKVLLFVCLLLVTLFFTNTINGFSKAKELIYDVNNFELSIEKIGVISTTYLDVKRIFWPLNEEITINKQQEKKEPKSEEIKYDANILNIDFNELLSKEKNSTLKNMHEYFANDQGTYQNKYTGIFKGKNLIFITAESFNEIGITKELTPTLYKMVNETFIFENFYTPINLSTLGGEYQVLTGQFAHQSVLSEQWKKATVSMPFGLGNKFNEINYKTYAYHNGEYYFQGRNKYLAKSGFSNYLACKNGIEKLINCNPWPRSDMEMISKTFALYSNSYPFMTYYMTNSGHLPYLLSGPMYKKHKEMVEDLPFSDNPRAYIASMIELDLAMKELIENLEKINQLENTVIVIVADHYPYDLTLNEVNELAKYTKDELIEINRSSLIIWNSNSPTIRVSKVANQLDVLPTVYNLFGIEYDSRLFSGKDILSNEPGLVYFSNRSWVTDFGKYYSRTSEFVVKENAKVDENYVDKINTIVKNRINMSKLIMENNYYAKIEVK